MNSAVYPLIMPVQFGVELRAARKVMGVSQTNLARHLGLSQSRVSYLELNPQDLSVSQLLVWCSVVGLELQVGVRKDGGLPLGGPSSAAKDGNGAEQPVPGVEW